MSWSGFKKNVGRATTQVMMKTGQVEKTSDRQYEVEERRYRTLESASLRLQKEAKGYLDSLRAMTASQMRIAETIDAFYGDSGAEDGVSRSYKQAVEDLDAETVKALDGPYRTTVLEPINRFCAYFPDINECIKKRNHKMLDYDSMRSKVKRLTEKPDKDPAKLPRTEKEQEMVSLADFLRDAPSSSSSSGPSAALPPPPPSNKKRAGSSSTASPKSLQDLITPPKALNGFRPEVDVTPENPAGFVYTGALEEDDEPVGTPSRERRSERNLVSKQAKLFRSYSSLLAGPAMNADDQHDLHPLERSDVSFSTLGGSTLDQRNASTSTLRGPTLDQRLASTNTLGGPSLDSASVKSNSSTSTIRGPSLETETKKRSDSSTKPTAENAKPRRPSNKLTKPPPRSASSATIATSHTVIDYRKASFSSSVSSSAASRTTLNPNLPSSSAGVSSASTRGGNSQARGSAGSGGNTSRSNRSNRSARSASTPFFEPSELEEIMAPLKAEFLRNQADDLKQAKVAYDQLNEQLMSELPQLIDLRVPYLDPTFEALVKIQLRFCAEAYSRMAQVQQYLDASTRDQYASGDLDARVEDVLGQIRELSIAGTV